MKKEEAQELTKQALADLEAELEAGCSETLTRYLDTMSRFHTYSWHNCLLILSQQPEATHVAGFRRWLKLGRHVRKGEKGIGIVAPLIYRKREEDDGGDDSDRVLRGFKIVHVFDVSQTEGEELPELAQIHGDPGELLDSLERLIQESGIELKEEASLDGAKGVSRTGEIAIVQGLSPAERFAILVHELGHEWMHTQEHRKNLSKTVLETEAEAVSYVVCRSFGFDCSTRSSDYIQMYRGDAATLIQSLERIQKTATRIIEALSQAFSREQSQQHVA